MNPLPKIFTTNDGLQIFYQREVPYNPKGIIAICHGYSEHSFMYQNTMAMLVDAGYGVYALDQRGNGRSQGEKGDIEKFEDFIEDFYTFIQRIQDQNKNVPIYTLGHSMGGLVSFLYALQHTNQIAGQIFVGPAWGPPWGLQRITTPRYEKLLKAFSDAKLHRIFQGPTCRDKEHVQRCKDDSYRLQSSTIRFFYEFLYRGLLMADAAFENYNLPCLILHGTGDKVIPYEHSIAAYHRLGSEDKTLKLCEGCYHELLHEPERGIIHQLILRWLKQQETSRHMN
ncbi:MAG: alpha/beta hydrolase [Epulopiscium sp.]|nr:alpha/beta hydrolase [Candidatus Epulonipiscium sp.]